MKKSFSIVLSMLTIFVGLTAFAVSPCAPKGTALALYVNCGPISRNADAQAMWKSLQEESHYFQDIADGVDDLVKEFHSDTDEAAGAEAWNSARFDWVVLTLGDYKFKPNDKGKLRIPPIALTVGGAFEAEPFAASILGNDLEEGKSSEIKDLGFTAYRIVDEDLSEVANVKPCFAVPQDGLLTVCSNTKLLKKIVGLYEGKFPPEPAVSKVFEKSPNGVFALYADLDSLKKDDIAVGFAKLGIPKRTLNDWFTILDNFSQIRVYLSVESAKDVHIALEYVAKGKFANQLRELQKSQADKEFDGAMCEFLETMIAEAGLEDLKLKDLKVSHKGTLMRMEATINAIFLAKLIDAPNEDVNAADDDEEDDE